MPFNDLLLSALEVSRIGFHLPRACVFFSTRLPPQQARARVFGLLLQAYAHVFGLPLQVHARVFGLRLQAHACVRFASNAFFICANASFSSRVWISFGSSLSAGPN